MKIRNKLKLSAIFLAILCTINSNAIYASELNVEPESEVSNSDSTNIYAEIIPDEDFNQALDLEDKVDFSAKKQIIVDVDNQKLFAFEFGKIVFTSKVIVGAAKSETPNLSTNLTHIVLNPTWTPTSNILKNEYIGKPSSFRRSGLVITDSSGKRVNPSAINKSNFSKYKISQPAGSSNALGQVKFVLENSDNIYLHDTNNKKLFNRENRKLSHGCVRVQKYKKLSSWLQDWSTEQEKDYFSRNKTNWIKQKEKVPVELVNRSEG